MPSELTTSGGGEGRGAWTKETQAMQDIQGMQEKAGEGTECKIASAEGVTQTF